MKFDDLIQEYNEELTNKRKWYDSLQTGRKLMKIYTLNVNGFRGSNKGIYDEITQKELLFNLNNLKSLIDILITDSESVIVLQEVPHKLLVSKDLWKWEENLIYTEFISVFSKEYKIIRPRHLIDSNQCTIALCTNDSQWHKNGQEILVYDKKYSFGNKLVELQYNNTISLLGVHMKPDDEMWSMIFKSYKKAKHTFIVGDFNAYEQRGSMKNKAKELRSLNYYSCIPANIITEYKDDSSLDNIYIDTDLKLRNGFSVSVKRSDIFQTDHALCSIEIDIY